MSKKLGKISQITIGCKDVAESYKTYEKLGFKKIIAQGEQPNKWMQITDTSLLILLNEDGLDYIGLTYFHPNLEDKVADLEAKGIKIAQKSEHEGQLFQVLFASPDGLFINLINHAATEMYQPDGVNIMSLPEKEWANTERYPNKECGFFGELCHPVTNMKKSVEYWKLLGFDAVSVNQAPYPWAIMYDGKNIVGLHQTTDFNHPAITYFAKDMGERVKALEKAGVHSIEVFGGHGGGDRNNVIVHTPEGQHFFLFSF